MTRKRDSLVLINQQSSQPMLLRIGPLLDPHPAFGLVPLEEGTVQSPRGACAYKI